MKKTSLFLLALLIFFSTASFTKTTYSDEKTFARAITEDVGFYLDDTGSELIFFLPYTYYVEVLLLGEPYSHVRIYGNEFNPPIDGYVLTKNLYFDGETPLHPYVELNLYTAETTPLYSQIGKGKIIYNVFKDRKLNYYGHVYDENGNYYYYVSYNDYLGYVKETSLKEFNFVLHQNPLPQENAPENDLNEETTSPKKDDSLIKGIILSCLIFATVLILVVLIRPNKNNYDSRYYDDNDYE